MVLAMWNWMTTGLGRMVRPFFRGISVITATNKPWCVGQILDNYRRQAFRRRELIVLVNGGPFSTADLGKLCSGGPGVTVVQAPGLTLGAVYNLGMARARYRHAAIFEDDDVFLPGYLDQVMEAFAKSRAAVVGKLCRYYYFESLRRLVLLEGVENAVVDSVAGGLIAVDLAADRLPRFRDVTLAWDSHFMEDCRAAGQRIYATDRRHLVVIRHADKSKHTFKLSDERFVADAPNQTVRDGIDLADAVALVTRASIATPS
jgi:hypothetical protein